MTSKDELRELKEKLAAIEHERWADWQKWCHEVLYKELGWSDRLEKVLERWRVQIETPYSELSDREKASDMEQVDRYWPLILNLLEGEKRKAVDDVIRMMEWLSEGTIKERKDKIKQVRATLNKEPNKGEDVDG